MSTEEHPASNAQAVIQAVREGANSEYLSEDSIYGVAVPHGSEYKVLDPYEVLKVPKRKAGAYKVSTVDALVAYVKAHEDTAATTVWVHPTSGQVVAVLDDHAQGGEGAPGYREHTATLDLIVADEWTHWLGRDGTLTSQEEFAEHLEDGSSEIIQPDAATLLEIAQSFHATTNAEFQSGVRLSDGEIKLTYNEETTATAGRARDLEIPQEIELSIRPFLGEDTAAITARLRYRVRSGTLVIGYKLNRPEIVVRDVLNRVASRLSDELANVYIGERPA